MNISISHKRHNSLAAFTLIELMVVVGIITILGVIVGPGFKKAYEDFLLKETLSNADVLLQSYRSYYLIYNEFPGDTGDGKIAKEVATFLPSNFFLKTEIFDPTIVYQFANKPFNDSTLVWDFNNWISWNGNTTTGGMYLSVVFPAMGDVVKINTYVDVFKNQYPLDRPQAFLFKYQYGAYYICIPFPEFPLKSTIDSISSNRYY